MYAETFDSIYLILNNLVGELQTQHKELVQVGGPGYSSATVLRLDPHDSSAVFTIDLQDGQFRHNNQVLDLSGVTNLILLRDWAGALATAKADRAKTMTIQREYLQRALEGVRKAAGLSS